MTKVVDEMPDAVADNDMVIVVAWLLPALSTGAAGVVESVIVVSGVIVVAVTVAVDDSVSTERERASRTSAASWQRTERTKDACFFLFFL